MQELFGKDVTNEEFRRVAAMGGLFASKRFVVWHDPFSAAQAERDAIAASLQQLTEDSVVVLVMDQLPKKIDALAELVKASKQEQFPALGPAEQVQWITQTALHMGVKIDAQAARALAERVGNNLWLAWNTLHKLSSLMTQISVAGVKEELPDPTTDSVFAFTDAFTARRSVQTLKLLHEQLGEGTSPFQLLALLARQLSVLGQLKETGGQGSTLHAFVVKKTLPFVQQIELKKLQQARQRLLEDELKIKTGQVDPVVALDLFVIDWCQ